VIYLGVDREPDLAAVTAPQIPRQPGGLDAGDL